MWVRFSRWIDAPPPWNAGVDRTRPIVGRAPLVQRGEMASLGRSPLRSLWLLVAVALTGAVLLLLWRWGAPAQTASFGAAARSSRDRPSGVRPANTAPLRIALDAAPFASPDAAGADAESTVRTPFGADPTSLGRGTTADGHPTGPTSPVPLGDRVLFVDGAKQRLVEVDARGAIARSIALPVQHVDDLARLSDGRFVLLDRASSRAVVVTDAAGNKLTTLPLDTPGAPDPETVSRMVVRGGEVFLESNGGGPLFPLGGVDGNALDGGRTVDGIPTHDGRFLMSAGVTNEEEGRAWLNLSRRDDGLRVWTRELQVAGEVTAVGFLDDGGGRGWLVLLVGGARSSFVDLALCFSLDDGALLARHVIRTDEPPWASFRDFSVRDDGALVALRRSDLGAALPVYPCSAP